MTSEHTERKNTAYKVLVFDFETNGFDAKKDLPTEIAAVLYEVTGFCWTKLAKFESLIYEETYPAQSEHIVEVTGITDEMLKTHGRSRSDVAKDFERLYSQADIICAHKLDFDLSFLKAIYAHAAMTLTKKEGLCSLSNFKWPKKFTCHKLGHLAFELGLDVKAADLHRAINDVELLAKVLGEFDFQLCLEYARKPWTYLKAEILGPWEDGGRQKSLVTAKGFSWEKVRGVDHLNFPKTWVKRSKDEKEIAEIKELGRINKFRVATIEGIN